MQYGSTTRKIREFIVSLENKKITPIRLKLSRRDYDAFMAENGLRLPGPGWVQMFGGTKIEPLAGS